MTVYVSIGNSDDKLAQKEWSDFVRRVDLEVRDYAYSVHGFWLSPSHSQYQNACWCFEIDGYSEGNLKDVLRSLLGMYRQDSIAWAVAQTEFIGGA